MLCPIHVFRQLGEHGEWAKHTNFGIATNAPMMIHVPGVTDTGGPSGSGGHTSLRYVEFVDLFPTVVEAAMGTSYPSCGDPGVNSLACTDGVSLLPVLSVPDTAPHDSVAVSQYANCAARGSCYTPQARAASLAAFGPLMNTSYSGCRAHPCQMGYTMITRIFEIEFRYTEWVEFNSAGTLVPDFEAGFVAGELYNHNADPLENVNLYGDPSVNQTHRELLRETLHRCAPMGCGRPAVPFTTVSTIAAVTTTRAALTAPPPTSPPMAMPGDIVPRPSLRALAGDRLMMGSAANINMIAGGQFPMYSEILAGDFNLYTPENCMKMTFAQPQRGVFAFDNGDRLVAFAREHGAQIRAHNLIWTGRNPDWLVALVPSMSALELDTVMHDHINRTARHFRGQVYSWDVVNEAIENNVPAARDCGHWRCWMKTVSQAGPVEWNRSSVGDGTTYVDRAFRYAAEADPTARLFYNEYGIHTNATKFRMVASMLADHLSLGVPIHGVGIQMHINSNLSNKVWDPEQFRTVLTRFTGLGLEVHLTEFDVVPNDRTVMAALDPAQRLASIYTGVIGVCLEFPGCKAVSTWGFSDAYNRWGALPPPGSFYYDADYRPKLTRSLVANLLAASVAPPANSSSISSTTTSRPAVAPPTQDAQSSAAPVLAPTKAPAVASHESSSGDKEVLPLASLGAGAVGTVIVLVAAGLSYRCYRARNGQLQIRGNTYQNHMFDHSRRSSYDSRRSSMQDVHRFDGRDADDDILIEDADTGFSVL